MKILYVISDRNIGGAGIQLLNVLRHLDRHAFAVTVALPFRSRLRERLIGLRVPVRELETPCEMLTRRSVCELVSVIRSEAPDIVHTNAAIAARVAGRLCGCRVVFTRHCAYPAAANATPLCARIANRLLTDRAIATAAAAARDLLAMGVPSGAITVILNGSDPVREVSADELDRWRSRLRLEPDDFCVGICARLEPCKGHDVFLRAAKIALGRMPLGRFRFLLLVVGSRRAALGGAFGRGSVYGVCLRRGAALPVVTAACQRVPRDRDFLSCGVRGDECRCAGAGERLRREPRNDRCQPGWDGFAGRRPVCSCRRDLSGCLRPCA